MRELFSYTRYDDGFRNWLGFVPRVGYDDWYGQYKYTDYFTNPYVTEVGTYMGYERLEGLTTPRKEGGGFGGIEINAFHDLYATISLYPKNGFVTEQVARRYATYEDQVRELHAVRNNPKSGVCFCDWLK
jgi:hypothetical protein